MKENGNNFRLSGKKYQSIFDALPHPAYIWQKKEDDLILITYNKAAEDITEGKVEKKIGIKASDHYKERPKILRDLKKCVEIKSEISREVIHELVTTGKERNFVRFYNFIEPDLVLVHTEDITKQKRAEKSYKREEREKSMILDAVSDLILYYDTNQNIIWANRASNESLDLPNEALIGRNCYELWHERKEPCEKCPVLLAKVTGTTQSGEIQSPDGRVWMVLGFPVRNDEGTIMGMVEICRDITARKYVEDNLRRERDILSRIADTSPVGIVVLNKVGKIIFANPQAEKILGLTKNEITQLTYNAPDWKITDFDGNPFPDEDLPFQRVKNTSESAFDVRHAILWPNGQKRYLSINASPIFDEEGNFDGMVATIEDITEKWMIEENLKDSEEKYRTLFENMNAGFAFHEVIVDDNNKPIDYKYIEANPAFEKMTGLKASEIIDKTVTEILPGIENDPADWIGKFGDVGLTGVPLTVEDYSEPLDRWFNVSGYSPKKGYFAVTFHDITERKKAEQELIESEEKFRKIGEQSFMGIGIIQDNLVKYVNDAMAEILEYTVEEMMTWTKDFNITNIILPEDLPRLREQRELRRGGEFNLKPYVSYRVISKSGKVKWIDQYSKNILFQGREAELIIITDITEKKNAEQKLKESEQFLQNVFNAIQDGVSVLDRDLNIIRVNQWMEKMYSSKLPLVGKKCYEVYQNRANVCSWCPSVKTFETGEKYTEIVPYPSAETPTGWIDLTAFPLKDKNGNVVNVIEYVKDITNQKKAEYKLKESEEKYRVMAELLPDVIFEADLNLIIKYVNPAGYDMFGYSPQDVEKGINLTQIITPDSLKEAKERIKEIFDGKTTSPNEYELLKKNGTKFYGRVHSRPIYKDEKIIGLRGTVTDITDIKAAEQKLKESEEKFRTISEQILVGIGIIQDGKIVYINDWALEIFGYTLEEMRAWPQGGFARIIHPEDREREAKYVYQILNDPNIHEIKFESRGIKKSGGIFWADNIFKKFIYKNRPALLGIFIDITERREAERKLKESEEKYREAYNRINLYKDLFTHDINNIFQNILSSNELAMLYSNIPDKLQDYVEVANLIKEQVSRGAKLVSNVQKLSELEEFKKPLYSIEVGSVLNNVIDSIKKSFLHKQINIDFQPVESQCLIKANELIFDVFENILINAVKHNRNQKIEIQIKISKKLIDNEKYMKIECIDNGIGIPDIMKVVIFQRDVKKEKASGIGLGLLLIKRILESYNGSIKVEDRIPGDYSKGSNFIVLIPEA